METQETISTWGRETFGQSTALALATRMNVEVAELINALQNLRWGEGEAHVLSQQAYERLLMAREECADVGIMLDQVMDVLGGNLAQAKTVKMGVNRKRKWGRLANGKMQHVETSAAPEPPVPVDAFEPSTYVLPEVFKEPGTGVDMYLNKWYVISDSGAAYFPLGFASPEVAADWAKSPAVVKEHGGRLDLHHPIWVEEQLCWPDGLEACNVVKGEHCYKFWKKNDPQMIEAESWGLVNQATVAGEKA